MPVDTVAGGAIVGPAIPAVAEIAQEIKLSGKYPEFADLKIPLAQSKQTDNALSQVVATMIDRLTQGQSVTAKRIEQVKEAGSRILSAVEDRTSKASIHTKFDDRLILPNSIQLLAGLNITFDDSVAGKRTISATGGGSGGGSEDGYWTPLTDGNVDETQLIFAAGECIAVFVPTP
jgi:flagellar hook-basal body complex protein FliE